MSEKRSFMKFKREMYYNEFILYKMFTVHHLSHQNFYIMC